MKVSDLKGTRAILVNVVRTVVGVIFLALAKHSLRSHFVSFVFHEVNDQPSLHTKETNTYSTRDTFSKQIDWIVESCSPVDLKNPANLGRAGHCLISFDDGYRGVAINAIPELSARGIPFTCFINLETVFGGINSSALAMFISNRNRRHVVWADSRPEFFASALEELGSETIMHLRKYQGPYIDEEDLSQLNMNPLVTLSDHLHNHWYIPAMTLDEFVKEVKKGEEGLKDYSSFRKFFAAPHGVFPRNRLQSLFELGYEAVFADRNEELQTSKVVFPRIDMNERIDTKVKFYGAIAIARLRGRLLAR